MPNKREYIRPYGEFEMDEATGLPTVPEGYFWRVTRPQGRFWQVQLRKRTWYGSRRVAWAVYQHEMTASKVNELAGYVLKYKVKKEPAHEMHLVGDYPPKTRNN